VIVFDRIRENVPRMPRATFSQIANRSMSEVFTRSLATSFVVLMPVGSLLLFGGETLKDFAFALLVGVLSGAYSSIFIATPVLVEWKERELTYMRRRRLMIQEYGGRIPAFPPGVLGEPVPAAASAGAGARAAAAAPAEEAPAPTSRAGRRQRREAAARTAAPGRSSSTTRTAPRPAAPGDGAPSPGDGAPAPGDGAPAPGDGAPPSAGDTAPASPPPERAAQPSGETPASPSAPAAPSSPPSKPKAKSSRRQRRRKHGRR
jgi:SecD/SecF fusion protein